MGLFIVGQIINFYPVLGIASFPVVTLALRDNLMFLINPSALQKVPISTASR